MGTSSDGGGPVRLSRREMEVARLVAEGLTNREIAQRLFVSERTVDGHLEHVREKLGFNTRAQIATWVTRHGDAAAEVAQPSPKVAPGAARISKRWWLTASAVLLVVVEAAVVLQMVSLQGPRIVTVAGMSPTNPPEGFFSGDRVAATAAVMSLPSDVAAAGDGTLYIADYRNKAIRRVSGGLIVTWAGRGKNDLQNGELGPSVAIGHASNIAVDAAGRSYILTIWNGVLEVWTIDPNKIMRLVVTVGPSRLQFGQYWPPPVGGLAVGPRGIIYISDRGGNKVYSYTPGDAAPKVVAGTDQAGFSGDGGAASGASLDRPSGLAVDGAGNLYIADSGNNRIRRVNTIGEITTVAGGGGKYYGDTGDGGKAITARLSFPFGVAVGRNGTIYIADTGNNRIREVLPSGVIVALAGTGIGGIEGDGGPAISAQLAAPQGIALDGKGNLFVADTLNLRIREIVGVER